MRGRRRKRGWRELEIVDLRGLKKKVRLIRKRKAGLCKRFEGRSEIQAIEKHVA
jgi:hypothetical protein